MQLFKNRRYENRKNTDILNVFLPLKHKKENFYAEV